MQNVFKTRAAVVTLGLLVIQQLIVASSSLWLVRFSESITTGRPALGYLGLFVASLTLVYLPSVFASIWQERWRQEVYRLTIGKYLSAYKGRVDLLSNPQIRQEKHSFFARESFSVIDSVTGYFYGLTATALNVGLNIMVIAAVLDWSLLAAYAASALISIYLVRKAMADSERMATSAQQERVALSDQIMGAWNTLLVANSHNLSLLEDRLERQRAASESASVAARRVNEFLGIRTSYLAMVPVIGTILYLVWTHYYDAALLIGMVATLHRQVMIIQFMESLVNSGIEYGSIKGLWTGLESSLQAPPVKPLSERVSASRIQVADGTLEGLTALPAGRFTLRGPNGSGKSSWLMHMKQQLDNEAYYLPAHIDFPFEQNIDSMSSGQKVAAALREVSAKAGARVYLLDEWDANLDDSSIAEMNHIIDRMAESSCVVEVRHRA